MTEPRVLPDAVERFLDAPVASPSLPELRAAGRVAVRRRRRRGLAGTAAAVVLVVGGIAIAQTSLGGNDDRADDPVAPPADITIDPPPGTRWAGIGRVVLAVPEAWSDGDMHCRQPRSDTVYFVNDSAPFCRPASLGRFSSLAISDQAFDDPLEPDGKIAGHDVRMIGGCLKAIDGPCFARIAIPDLDAYFEIRIYATDAAERIQSMRDTLTVLPEGALAPAGPPVFGGLQCLGYQVSSGTFDVIPPRSKAAARRQGWPQTAEEAVSGLSTARLGRDRFGPVTLSEHHSVRHDRVQFALVNADGRRVAILTVEELMADVWAVTGEESCAG